MRNLNATLQCKEAHRQYAVSVLAQPRDPNLVCVCMKVRRVVDRIRDLERTSIVQYWDDILAISGPKSSIVLSTA